MPDATTQDRPRAGAGLPGPLATLLATLVDYAGLFPPASRLMVDAVDEYAARRRGPHAWMLGRFVVPAARLDELADAARAPWGAGNGPWPLTVLAGLDTAAVLERFAAAHARDAEIASIETKAGSAQEIATLAAAFPGLEQYVEISPDADLDGLFAALAAHGLRAKIRMGGVVAEAFPSAARTARFLGAAADAGVPIKATAGLHHPLRGEYRLTYASDSPEGTMFGFLNVFVAAALARHGVRGAELEAVLEERDPRSFEFAGDGVRWRAHRLGEAALRDARRLGACSFGSCSFAEPVEDLHRLGLLPR